MGHAMWTPEFEPSRRQRVVGEDMAATAVTATAALGRPVGRPDGRPAAVGRADVRPRLRRRPGWPRSAASAGTPGRRTLRDPRRAAHLAEPINGYQVIQQIAERTDGVWKPSPGSVYPTIAQLQDEGLVEDAPTGRKAIQLTDEGRAYVAEHPEEMAAVWAPFAEQVDDDEAVNFKQVIGQTVGAIVQVATTGTPDQREKAIEILGDTRRRLYGLLAEGPDAAEDIDDDA